jgi:hypothetical protein
MMVRLVSSAAALALLALGGAAGAQQPAAVAPVCEQLLPVREAQRLSGVKPLHLVGEREVPHATGTCNYATDGKRLVFLVSVEREPVPGRRERFERDSKTRGVKVVPDVGDFAFSKDGAIYFRKGPALASVGSFVDVGTGRRWMDDKRAALVARAVAKKL